METYLDHTLLEVGKHSFGYKDAFFSRKKRAVALAISKLLSSLGAVAPPCFPGYASGREVSRMVNLAFRNGWMAPLLVAHLLLKVSILQTE